MPELPEVEKAARALAKAAVGKIVAAVRPIHPSLKRRFTPAHARRSRGRRVESVERRGKHQLLNLDSGDTIVIHFRMNGDWEIGTVDDPVDRFARAVIDLTDGTRIALVDRRALSTITLDREGSSSLPKLGREASDPSLDAAYLFDVLPRRNRPIRSPSSLRQFDSCSAQNGDVPGGTPNLAAAIASPSMIAKARNADDAVGRFSGSSRQEGRLTSVRIVRPANPLLPAARP